MIDSPQTLADFLSKLRAASWVAMDTEADSLHSYPEKLCLVQISLEGRDALVDPLAGLDLSDFWAELRRHELILHGADYDLRLMRKGPGFVPERVFDTMLAARLLGEREFGLTNLVAKYLGVTLEKGSQRADWSRRPLTPKMEAYARNDSHYLNALATFLRRQLQDKGRLEWQRESCERLIAECSVLTPPDPDLVWRIRGSHALGRVSLAVMRELWAWREREAVAANRPPYFILSHEAMVGVAEATPRNAPIDGFLPRHFSARRKDGLLEAIAAGLAVEPSQQPHLLSNHSRRMTSAELDRFAALENRRNRAADDLVIDPTLIASRATLLALARDWDKHAPELMNWQRQLLG